ncbi:hypothetical protein Btru_066586 [Bulinus truncatus]|nr:hypothetical protein Btru_066586 [Bulinus truncatus]
MKSLFVVFVCLAVFMTPYMMSLLLDIDNSWTSSAHVACTCTSILNSSINWLLYGLMNHQFRQGYIELFKGVSPNKTSFQVSTLGLVKVSGILDYEISNFYEIHILVQDDRQPVHNTTVIINLKVIDINDNDPSFIGPFTFSVNESDVVSSKVLYQANASGNDGPTDVVTYSLLDRTYFDISPTSGEISIRTTAPDYEIFRDYYNLTVCATDTPNPVSRTVCQNITATLIDVDDNVPVFSPSIYSASVKEDVPQGVVVSTVTARDADISPAYHTVHYTIIDGNSEKKFSIDNNGSVTINATLDYETTTNYSLVIQASDSLHSANTSLNVLVIPVNEYSPVFPVTNLTLSLPENSPFDTNFTLNISATDRDHGLDGKIFYRIEPGPFSIDPATGVMRVISNLDRETKQTYVLLVQAIDKGIPSKTGTLTLTVEVTDENDNIPECTSVVYTALVSEGTKSQSQLITKLMCHDDDKDPANLNNKITYSIVSGETTKFEINQSGELILKSNVTLDFESDQKYQIVVKVMDSGLSVQLSSSVTIDVMVKDENDNPPVFIALPSVIIPEDVTVGSKLATVKATDRDSGDNGVILFTITKGNNDTRFTIDPWNGDIYLTSQLDFETQRIFELEITARDLGLIPLSATGTMTVNVTDINDNVPNCNMIVNASSLFENSKNVDIASLNCTDKDTVGSLAYSIASVSGINSTFFIINQTGVISVIPAAQIDYETTQQFTLQIQISDGVHSVFSFVKITVLDIDEFDPLFFPPGPYSVNITEDVRLNTALITIHATDEDKFDNFKYFSIVNGNTDNKFLMDPVTGSVRVLNSLDYETTKFYSLTLQVTDSGNRSRTTVVNITVVDVNDNHPFCNSTWEVIAVNENDFNKTLYVPDCSDLDSNLDINSRYTLVSGNLSSLYFNRTTGAVYLISPLDYEVMTSHTVVIKAFDNGLPDVGVDITLTIIVKPVNEYSPEFSPSNVYNVSVSEDAPVGSLVFKVNATDQDKGYLQGTVRYSITGGDPHQYFEIDESSGEIKTVTPLDRETFESYNITVEAADDFPGSAASRKSTATCIVKINDVNDNTPVFNASLYTANLLETDNGHAILTVFATDKDDPFTKDYGKVTYNIVNGGSDFTIDPITGEINNSHVIDADATGKTFYTISVVATDSGGLAGALKSTTLVAIKLITVNEFKPEFSLPSYSVSINETQFKFGDEILNFSAKDNDAGQDGEFTFEFALPQTKFVHVQDGKKGKIILNEALDFENNDTLFHFQVLAKDKGNPSMIGTADVTIIVNDDNDNSPTCISVINVDVPENTAHIANLTCNDRDTMTAFSYIVDSIIPPSINVSVSSNGVVTASPVLDYEKETSYKIVIQVFDASFSSVKHTASVVINLRVRDLNDNPPFIAGPYNFTISEDEAISSKVLYRLNASGNDGPTDYLTYSLYPSTYFALTPLSGEITLKSAAPDYEIIGPQYIFTVCVTDTPNPISFTVCQNITASIIDVNDVSPVFSPAVYSVSIAESAIVGTNLSVAVTANDGDISPNFKTVTYTIIDGNVAGKFKIDGKNGVISLAQQLDYEIVTSYALIVQATDSKFTTNASYFIQISPVNEFPPTFNISVINYNITENTLTNVTFSLPFKVTDGDSGLDGQFTYSIDEGPFEIDPSTGLLSVISNIDREKNQFYALLIKAIDKGSEPKTGTLTLSVNVLDENDNVPTCSQYFYTAMFAEEVQFPMIVAALNCLDLDKDPLQKNNAIFYTLVSNNTSLFEVTSNGVIQVKSGVTFDRETQDFYEVIVEVSDQALIGRLTTTVVAEITITDLNDNSPIFTNQSSKNLSEDLLPGSFVIKVQANDKDIGKNAELTYSIVGGNTENKFRIDTVTGTINLESYLDYETTQLYKLVITAIDRGSPSLTGSMTLTVTVTDVNDNPPFCPSFFSPALVNENTQNVSLGSMSCSDKDTVGSLTYSIISGNVENNFGIDTKGYVFVQPNAQLDFEVKQNYLLQIFVTDGVHNVTELMKVSLIDVNEFKPRFFPSGPYNTTVKENANVGSTVFVLNATDDDIYDNTRTYSIIDASMHQKFIMDSNYIKILSLLDYELEKSYTFSLMVQDSTALNDTTTITVYVEDVNDNNPSCNESSAIVSVDENVSNKVLYVPQCTDADKVASPSLVFSILPSSIPALSVNNTTGVLSLQSGLDYEQNTTIRVVMKVVDNGSPALSTSINIWININPVNEYPPEFTQLSYGPYSLLENVSLGTQVAILTATDKDKGSLQGTVRYQIIAGDDQQYFTIDETTGALKVIRNLDRESRSSYNLTVKASDDVPGSANQKTATVDVSILVTDVNDEKPVFTQGLYFLNVSESAKAGPTAELLKFKVLDGDMGINSQTTIAITSGNTENRFSITGKSLLLTQNLDYETTDHYELILTVTDSGSPPLSSNCTVIIDVLPSNDNSPLMNVTSMTKTIAEDLPVGTLIFDADASDMDKGMQGRITYEIASGVPSDDFVIDSANGKLYVGSLLDFDAGPKNYSIIIRAVDGDSISPRTSTASLSLILSDVNDNPPVFTPNSNVFSVNENSLMGLSLGQLLVTDADSGVNGQITLSLTGGNGLPYFAVNTNKQLVTTSVNIDYETNKVLFLTVKAVDGGSPSLMSHSLVKIDINNMNDNFPTITPVNFTVHVMENATIGTVVQNYIANDLDTLVDLVKLSSSDLYFDINSSTAVLTLKSLLDREKTNNHTLEIVAVDRATSVDPAVHSTTASITVIVDDINDNAPIITGTYSKSVPETIAVNELLFTISASDADAGVNSELSYTITAGNSGDSFKIDFVGNLLVAKPLDPDVVNHYTLTVTVSDRGTPSLSSTVAVGISVLKVNDPPVFELSSYIFNIDENSPVGTTVGAVTAFDKDQSADSQLFYSFVSFSLGSFSHFIINSSSGAILIASGTIDREKTPQYRGIVQVTDGGLPALTATSEVIVNVNDLDDNGPVFNPASYTKTVKENLPQGTSIVQLTTTDADSPANSDVRFKIITDMLDGSFAANFFQVNSAGLVTSKAILDYETYKNISFIVQASKPDLQLAVTASVLIILSDENDNSPALKASFVNSEVDYKKSCSDIVTQVSATDADSGDNARIVYSLDTTTYGGLFTVDSVTGDIKMNSEAEANKKYTIVVRVDDLGVPRLSSTATVRIDTFNPAETILSFYLSISKADFLSKQQTFITNLQNKLQQKYPPAVLKLWCISERAGVATSPGSTSRRRKREDTIKPVTVEVYALQDNNTQFVSNLGQQKQFLKQGDLMTTFNDVTNTNAGSEFNYFKIQSVKTYSNPESSSGWWDTVYGPIITAIVIALGLILIAVFIFCCFRHYRKLSERNSSNDEPEIPPEDYSYRHFKGYQGVEFYPVYPKSYPVRLVQGNAEQFTNPYFTSKRHTHL